MARSLVNSAAVHSFANRSFWSSSYCPGSAGSVGLALTMAWAASCLVAASSSKILDATQLTPDEKAWLQTHGPLRYAPDPAFPPFEFFRADGQLAGVTPDLLALIARRYGTEIRSVRYTNWSEVLAGMKRGEADLLGTLTRTPEREQFLDYTDSYLEVPAVLFVNKSSRYRSMGDLKGRRVGVVQDYGAHAWMRATHPNVDLVLMPNPREGLLRLALGQVDAMLEILPVGQWVIMDASLTSLRVLPETCLTIPQHLAVAKGNTRLLAILQKGLHAITESERREVFEKWTGKESLSPARRLPPVVWQSAMAVLAAALGIAAWNISLRRQLARKESEIRDQLKEEAALENRYRELVRNASDIVYVHDLDGNFTSINPAAGRLLGYTTEEALKLNVSQVVAPEHLQQVRQRMAEKLAKDVPTSYEIEIMTKDGRRRWLEVSTRLLRENGRPVAVQGIGRDITDKRLAEESLKKSLSLLQATLDATADGLLVVDLQGKVASYNRRFLEMWRIPTALVPLHSDTALLGFVLHQLKDPEAFLAKVRSLYADLEACSDDILEFKDGRVFERFSQPYRLVDEVVGRVWSFRDVTTRRRAEEEQRRLEEQVKQSQKLEAVGQLAAGVAHDFNNILTAIFGNASLLASELPPASKAGDYLRQITLNAERAATLTKQLLLFSRKQSAKLEPLDLNELIENLAKMLRRLIGEDIRLTCSYAANLPPVYVDRGMIEQTIVNLVVNARDAMPQGGTLALSTFAVSLNEEAARRTAEARPGVFVCLSVADSGTGMDAATQAHIFEPFFTTKEVGKGSGLGLATVHGIVQQHRGWIQLQSSVGKGSTFTVFLPAHSASLKPVQQPSERVVPSGKGETILLVEDEPAVRTIVHTTLERFGYDVVAAASGREALELWPAHAPAVKLLLTDIVMPEGTSGAELAACLRREAPSLRVVYMSGYSPETSQRRLSLPPGTRFLQKPCLPEDLAETVRACLDEPVSEPPPPP